MLYAWTHRALCYRCSVSLMSPVLSWFNWPAWTRIIACLPACLPVCVHVLFLHNHHHYRLLSSLPSSEGYEKSRSLNNIAGMTSMAGNTLRLSPVTSPYGSPCPLRRSRSPIPSILWDAHFLPALAQSHAHILVPNRAPAFGNKPGLCSWWDWRKSS